MYSLTLRGNHSQGFITIQALYHKQYSGQYGLLPTLKLRRTQLCAMLFKDMPADSHMLHELLLAKCSPMSLLAHMSTLSHVLKADSTGFLMTSHPFPINTRQRRLLISSVLGISTAFLNIYIYGYRNHWLVSTITFNMSLQRLCEWPWPCVRDETCPHSLSRSVSMFTMHNI